MNVGINLGGAAYRLLPIEDLAKHIDDLAAVAWDRDMGDVALDPQEKNPDMPVLRFTKVNLFGNGFVFWCALTGVWGKTIARWEAEGRRWVRIGGDK